MGTILFTSVNTGERYYVRMGNISPRPTCTGYSNIIDGYNWFVCTSASNAPFFCGEATETGNQIVIPNDTYYVGDNTSPYTVDVCVKNTQIDNDSEFTLNNFKVNGQTLQGGVSTGGSYHAGGCYAFCIFQPTGVTSDYIGLFQGTKTNEGDDPKQCPMFMVAAIRSKFFENGLSVPYDPDSDHGGDPGDAGGIGGKGTGINDGDQIGSHNAGPEENGKKARLGYGFHGYIISDTQLGNLSKYLWGIDNDYMDALWKKWINYKFNPAAAIISCHRLPNELMPSSGASTSVVVGGTTLSGVGGLSAVTANLMNGNRVWSQEWTIPITPPRGNFLDFANVQMGVYLPFCGSISIDPSQVMGNDDCYGEIGVQYCCNALTGDCTAFVLGQDQFGNKTILGVAGGNCAEPHLLTGNDNGMGSFISALSTVASGVTSAAVQGNPGASIGSTLSGISQMATMQRHTQIVGKISGGAGWTSQWTCYAWIFYNAPVITSNYASEIGRPSMYSGNVGSFSGFTQLEVHADSVGKATAEEKREIERLCREGILI